MLHRTELLLDQAMAAQLAGHWESALSLCEQVFKHAAAERRIDDLLESLLRGGFILGAKAEREAAIERFELVVAIAELHSDASRAGRAYNGLGVLHQSMGALDAAESYYKSAKDLAARAEDNVTRGDVELNLGILANIRSDLHEALEHYRTAYSDYEAVGHQSRLAKVLNNLGMLYIDLQEFEEAARALEKGLTISRSISDVATEGILLTNRTELYLATGDVDAARRSCDEAFELASRLGDVTLKTDVLKSYGIIYREGGRLHLAESHLRQAVDLAQAISNPLLEAEATRELSLVLRAMDRNKEALNALNRSHVLFTELQAKQEQADIAQRLAQLEADFLSVVARWGESIEAKDRYTSGHCQRVADYACRLARAAGMSEMELVWFRMGAFLHDVGKTAVPEEILNKPGKLTPEERAIMEHHTIAGDEMLASIEFPWDIRPIVRSHHERWDGRGYPDGLAEEDIPFAARILHIADVFDALTTTRSYRQPLSPEDAFKLMEEDVGSFDPDLFELFRELFPTFIPPPAVAITQ